MWTRYLSNRKLYSKKMIDREDLSLIKNILSINNHNIDTTLLYNVLSVTKDIPNVADDLLDSFSTNQFNAKNKVLEYSEKLNILNHESEVIIFGSWFGSILIPGLTHKVKRITCIDLDEKILKISKNRIFKHYSNIDYIPADVFEKDRERYWNADLFINTSCEHMPPMKDWPYWPSETSFIFTSNNMYDIKGHINCVDTIDDFKRQLPKNSEVLFQDEIKDERGTRFLLAGQIVS